MGAANSRKRFFLKGASWLSIFPVGFAKAPSNLAEDGGDFGVEETALVVERVVEFDRLGMQTKAISKGIIAVIFSVADDRHTMFGEMDAYLVFSAAQETNFEECHRLGFANHPVFRL